jgi:hypothetical protein
VGDNTIGNVGMWVCGVTERKLGELNRVILELHCGLWRVRFCLIYDIQNARCVK